MPRSSLIYSSEEGFGLAFAVRGEEEEVFALGEEDTNKILD
jgi:hypothetical protein